DGVVGSVAEHLPPLRGDELLMAEMFRVRRQRLGCPVLCEQEIAAVVGGGLLPKLAYSGQRRRHQSPLLSRRGLAGGAAHDSLLRSPNSGSVACVAPWIRNPRA